VTSQWRFSLEQKEYRSSGVQEFRIILKERPCLKIGATSQARRGYNPPLSIISVAPFQVEPKSPSDSSF
jgi:hypothetical protein